MDDLNELIEDLEKITDDKWLTPRDKQSTIVKKIANFYIAHYQTEKDEVAIFLVNDLGTTLSFSYPEYLIGTGEIPINSNKPIVSLIYRSGKSLIDNEFLEKERLFQYEFVKTDDDESKLIWKTICTVLSVEDEKLGVIQISRKRAAYSDVGKDFSEEDLKYLETTLIKLAPYIKATM